VFQIFPLTELGTLWRLLDKKLLVFLFVSGVIVVEKLMKWFMF
jgi:hypothetical protein